MLSFFQKSWSAVLLGVLGTNISWAQNSQIRVSGQSYVEYGSDKTGLSDHASSGALCVVHQPNCGNVGHNGKDHFFPKSHPLPPGVTIERVDYIPFWPIGLSKTDRGGVGSTGSYGVDLAQPGQNGAFVDAHWQNACRDHWSGLPVAYQVSFVLSGPQAALDKVSKVNPSVPASTNPGFACSRKETPGPRPGEVAIESFTASWNNNTRNQGQTLVIPVGQKAILAWNVSYCGAGCSVRMQEYDGTVKSYIHTLVTPMLKTSNSLTVAPSSTVTTYVLAAYDDASTKDGVIESATITVQLTNSSAASCPGCQWWYFTLTSPPGFSTPECRPIAVYGTQATAAAEAQSTATNYKLKTITADQYFSDTGCGS